MGKRPPWEAGMALARPPREAATTACLRPPTLHFRLEAVSRQVPGLGRGRACPSLLRAHKPLGQARESGALPTTLGSSPRTPPPWHLWDGHQDGIWANLGSLWAACPAVRCPPAGFNRSLSPAVLVFCWALAVVTVERSQEEETGKCGKASDLLAPDNSAIPLRALPPAPTRTARARHRKFRMGGR